tara:strand:+ start:657 stop:914 length:258 start_codon:yes stop_codon:yes gene_type:complete
MYEQNELFEFDDYFEKDKSELENVNITTHALHYSVDELRELKKMSKILIKHYWGDNYLDGNINDLILKIFRNEYKKIDKGQATDQ